MKTMFFLLILFLTFPLIGMQESDIDLEIGLEEECKPLLQDYNTRNNERCYAVNSIEIKNKNFKQSIANQNSIPATSLKPLIFDNFDDEIIAHILSFLPANAESLNYIIRNNGFEPISSNGNVTPFYKILQNIYEAHMGYLIQKSQDNYLYYKDDEELYKAQNMLIIHQMLHFMKTKKYKFSYCLEDEQKLKKIIFPPYGDKEILDKMLVKWSRTQILEDSRLFREDIENCLNCYIENTQNKLNRLKAAQEDNKEVSEMYVNLRATILEKYRETILINCPKKKYFSTCFWKTAIGNGGAFISFGLITAVILSVGSRNIFPLAVMSFPAVISLGVISSLTVYLLLNINKIRMHKATNVNIDAVLGLLKNYKNRIALLPLEEAVD